MISCSRCSCYLSLAVLPSVWSWLSAFYTLSFVKDAPFFFQFLTCHSSTCLFMSRWTSASSRKSSRRPLVRTCCSRSLPFTWPFTVAHLNLAAFWPTHSVCLFPGLIVYLSSLFPLLWYNSCVSMYLSCV